MKYEDQQKSNCLGEERRTKAWLACWLASRIVSQAWNSVNCCTAEFHDLRWHQRSDAFGWSRLDCKIEMSRVVETNCVRTCPVFKWTIFIGIGESYQTFEMNFPVFANHTLEQAVDARVSKRHTYSKWCRKREEETRGCLVEWVHSIRTASEISHCWCWSVASWGHHSCGCKKHHKALGWQGVSLTSWFSKLIHTYQLSTSEQAEFRSPFPNLGGGSLAASIHFNSTIDF
jgi:hypothetical protein